MADSYSNNPYVVPNVDLSGLEGISKIGDRYREGKRREEFSGRVKQALESGDTEAMIQLNADFPQLSKAVSEKMIGFANERTKQVFSEGFGNVAQGLESARMDDGAGMVEYNPQAVEDITGQLEQGIAEVESRGGNPMYMKSVMQNMQEGDYEGAQREAKMGLLYSHPAMYASLYRDVGGKYLPASIPGEKF